MVFLIIPPALSKFHHYMSVGFFFLNMSVNNLLWVTFHHKKLFFKICSFIYTQSDFRINILYSFLPY